MPISRAKSPAIPCVARRKNRASTSTICITSCGCDGCICRCIGRRLLRVSLSSRSRSVCRSSTSICWGVENRLRRKNEVGWVLAASGHKHRKKPTSIFGHAFVAEMPLTRYFVALLCKRPRLTTSTNAPRVRASNWNDPFVLWVLWRGMRLQPP